MSVKFQNKYRIPSARAEWWNYGWNAAYFITICTAHREHFFGEIINGDIIDANDNTNIETGQYPISTNPTTTAFTPNTFHNSIIMDVLPIMQSSEIGRLAEKFWWSIPEHFPFVKLDAFVVMPNHIHGILVIDKPYNDDIIANLVETGQCVETGHCPVSTHSNAEQKTPAQLRFRNQGKETVSSIIGSYKSMVTKYAHRIIRDFEWQERFYDHIIRDEQEFEWIANYIKNNPANWENDKFYN